MDKKIVFAWLVAFGFIACIALTSADKPHDTSYKVKEYYLENLDSLRQEIVDWQKELPKLSQDEVQKRFKKSRHFYKKIECFVTYHFPATAQQLNAANLLEAEVSKPNEPKYPTGFQVIEEAVFDEENFDRHLVEDQLHSIRFAVNRLTSSSDELFLDNTNILDAIKLNLYRLITHGITGFDSPVSLNSLQEAISTLKGLEEIVSYFSAAKDLQKAAQIAANYVEQHPRSFDEFDRAYFIKEKINPLCIAITDYQNKNQIPFATSPPRAIKANSATMFDIDAMDDKFYMPAYASLPSKGMIELGEKLFNDNSLSINNNRNCGTCHIPSKAFTDGLPKNQSLFTDKTLLRNTPTLINAGLQPVQFYDSRVPFLEDQVHAVISSPDEMGSYFSEVVNRIANNQEYSKDFQKNFKNKKVTESNIKMAIAAYVRSLKALNSSFDKYMRGDETAMKTDEIKGFNLFMGKAKCGTCHFMPMFNGSVPPLYGKLESEVLGVPESDAVNAKLDSDLGKGTIYGITHQMRQFKTTSVRNAALTAPYMHNGVFKTLEEVIDFYDAGGGIGRGLEVENQTLPSDSLHLSIIEKKQLVLFIHALSDTAIRN